MIRNLLFSNYKHLTHSKTSLPSRKFISKIKNIIIFNKNLFNLNSFSTQNMHCLFVLLITALLLALINHALCQRTVTVLPNINVTYTYYPLYTRFTVVGLFNSSILNMSNSYISVGFNQAKVMVKNLGNNLNIKIKTRNLSLKLTFKEPNKPGYLSKRFLLYWRSAIL